MEKTPETIEIMVEKLFAACVFDPTYMDEEWCKKRYREALTELTQEEWDWIVSRCYQEGIV